MLSIQLLSRCQVKRLSKQLSMLLRSMIEVRTEFTIHRLLQLEGAKMNELMQPWMRKDPVKMETPLPTVFNAE